MIPLGAIIYIIKAAIFVLSLFMGMRLLFAHEMIRETWRSSLRRYVYISSKVFKTLSILLGWVLLLVALTIAYIEIDRLISG